MAAALSHGTRIGSPLADGTLVLGTILWPAFGEGFYCARFSNPEGDQVACVHRSEVVIDPAFTSLAEAAAALRDCDRREARLEAAA